MDYLQWGEQEVIDIEGDRAALGASGAALYEEVEYRTGGGGGGRDRGGKLT